ncbi:MAG: SoxR reducing system RseC family protein [Calditrichia bacterium]
MLEKGMVVAKKGDQIEIRMQPAASCEACNACFIDKSKMQVLHIEQNTAVEPGDVVEVEVSPGFAVQSAFLLFFLPLVMLVTGYFLFTNWLFIPGVAALYRGIIGAISGLFITYLLVHFYDRHLRKSGVGQKTRIIRVVS